jgi:protein-disulfide isomerase
VKLALLLFAACASDTQALEKRVDDLARRQTAYEALGAQIDALTAAVTMLKASAVVNDDKLAMLRTKLEKLGEAPPAPARRRELDTSKVWAVAVDGEPTLGRADAKVTLVEAMDYACPYCEKLRDTFADLAKKYGSDLRIVYKPFVVHPQVATTTALAACAATRQGKFAEMNTLLWDRGFKGRSFEKDKDCAESADGCPILDGYAKDAKLDLVRFKSDMVACKAVIADDLKALQTIGVGAIPTSFVNGRALVGAMPADRFESLIDEELKLANGRIAAGTKQASYYHDWVVAKGHSTADP